MPNTNPNPDRRAADHVRIAHCYASMPGGASDTEPMAVLGLAKADKKVMEPFCLTLLQAHVLIREMVAVLDALDHRGDDWTGDSFRLPPMPSAPTCIVKKRKIIRPSRRPSSPSGPIQETEAWQLHWLLKNVKSHADFLKFINASDIDATFSQTMSAQLSPPINRAIKAPKQPKQRKR